MKLQSLLQGLTDHPILRETVVTGLSLNSQHVQPGEVFIALKGAQHEGHAYIAEAIEKGARAVVVEAQGSDLAVNSFSVPVIPVPHLSDHLEALVQRFYGDPSKAVELIGVTGTNGKTTTTYLLAQALTKLNKPCAVVGTLGYGFINQLQETGLTTPDPISLTKYLRHLKTQGAQAVAMEVSSHGLVQGRVNHLSFASAIFTNLTQDHLDYHGSMEAYGQAKQKLFEFASLKRTILNADAPFTKNLLSIISPSIPTVLFSVHPSLSFVPARSDVLTICVKEKNLDPKGITAWVQTPWGEGELNTPLLGEFNLSNLLAVLAELGLQGFALSDALAVLSQVMPAPGRMQRLGEAHTSQILIDYAHTPDALENALKAARLHCHHHLWCVFGCGGGRDKTKRILMGAIAGQYADRIVLTNDNPRREDPQEIIDDILQGLAGVSQKVTVIPDRAEAIAYAMTQSLPVDTLLIAGKGHENYQIIGEEKFSFNDADCVKDLLHLRKVNKDNHEIVSHR